MSTRRVLAAVKTALAAAEEAVLATVVRTSGSTYRKAGASMLIRKSGETIGLLSGGCLERDITRAAMELDGERKLLHFDLTPDDDYLVGYGKGCAGQIWVLLELLRHGLMETQLNPLSTTANALLVASGERLVIDAYETVQTDIKDRPDIVHSIATTLKAKMVSSKPFFVESKSSDGKPYAWCGWYARPAIDLVIFGAGLDSIPVYGLATALNWRVRICDHRSSMLRTEIFPHADALIPISRDGIPSLETNPSTHVVIMSHDLLIDTQALVWAAERSENPYIGLLGPTQRRNRILEILGRENLDCIKRLTGRLRSPICVDLGGNTELDIALAIIAQIQRDWHGASARDLTESLALCK